MRTHVEDFQDDPAKNLKEAPPGFEPGMADLQSAAHPQKTRGKPQEPVQSVHSPYNSANKASLPPSSSALPHELQEIIDAWSSLPEAIRQTILSLVRG
jgi:hypothetical protein